MNSYKEQLQSSANFITSNDNFLIVSHVNPDGDTISSSLAMAHILQKLGKTFILVNQDLLPKKFSYLPMFDQIKSFQAIEGKFSYIITLDVADQFRTGALDSLLETNYSMLNIDHHPTNDYFGDFHLILPSAAATVEVVYDLIQEMNIEVNKEIATCIYTGLLTDTGGFRYSNTSPKVMRIAADLLEFDISPGEIAEIALETITLGHVEVLQKALENLEVIDNGFIALTTLALQDIENVTNHEDTEGIVNYTRNIEGVEVGIFFKETNEHEVKVSLRSKKIIDVGSIAKEFGGGGHARAAGYTYKGPLEKAKVDLLAKIKSKG